MKSLFIVNHKFIKNILHIVSGQIFILEFKKYFSFHNDNSDTKLFCKKFSYKSIHVKNLLLYFTPVRLYVVMIASHSIFVIAFEWTKGI